VRVLNFLNIFNLLRYINRRHIFSLWFYIFDMDRLWRGIVDPEIVIIYRFFHCFFKYQRHFRVSHYHRLKFLLFVLFSSSIPRNLWYKVADTISCEKSNIVHLYHSSLPQHSPLFYRLHIHLLLRPLTWSSFHYYSFLIPSLYSSSPLLNHSRLWSPPDHSIHLLCRSLASILLFFTTLVVILVSFLHLEQQHEFILNGQFQEDCLESKASMSSPP
jgi:hypothetical protein